MEHFSDSGQQAAQYSDSWERGTNEMSLQLSRLPAWREFPDQAQGGEPKQSLTEMRGRDRSLGGHSDWSSQGRAPEKRAVQDRAESREGPWSPQGYSPCAWEGTTEAEKRPSKKQQTQQSSELTQAGE